MDRSPTITGPITADFALRELMDKADLYRVGRGTYLVAPVDRRLLDTLIEVMGASEDLEDSGDMEPSIGPWDDREFDPLDIGEFDPCDLGEPEGFLL